MTLSPKHMTVPHIQFMAMIGRALDEEGRKRVLSAASGEELWKVLVQQIA